MCRPASTMNWNVYSIITKIPYEHFVRTFQRQVGREDIFKPTIANQSLHEISNDDGASWSSKLCQV
jgi:hypothetical protein